MHFRRLHFLALLASVSIVASGARAQEVVQQPTPDADELAGEMRALAANPQDVGAMVRAGELTLKLDDPTAAAGFFARAERIDPSNARIKAGKGVILVQQGKPGEALRRFGDAQLLGLDPRRFAAERGLAYDLIGEQERAQRDYRLALKDAPTDETIRRYALSLGISGKKDEALQQLDPLLRRSDRAAWRARAFILAMAGDGDGAERIAASMMPGGLGRGLQPFFDQLPRLGAADRAFAVHFGEVRGSPQRVLDARLAPAMAPLQPEPGRPVVLARNDVAPPVNNDRADKRNRKKNKKRGQDRIETATVAAPIPLPPPPTYNGQPVSVAVVQPLPEPTRQVLPPVSLAAARPLSAYPPTRREVVQAISRPEPEVDTRVAASSSAALPVTDDENDAGDGGDGDAVAPARSQAVPVVQQPVIRQTPIEQRPVVQQPVVQQPVVQKSGAQLPVVGQPVAQQPTVPPPVAQQPVEIAAMPQPQMAAPAAVVQPLPAVREAQPPGRGEDSILAKIIAEISVPGSELVDTPAAEPVALAEAEPAKIEPRPIAAARPTPDLAAEKAMAAQKAADKKANDQKIADTKKAADKKLADKKLADAKKAEDEKKKNDPKILEPSRIWVQVAGGANESTLPKEWARVRDKAPAAFKGKAGWTTPLRATNRVLAGPFKSDAEARTFVNLLAKADISAFTFTSDAGQKVTKLPAK